MRILSNILSKTAGAILIFSLTSFLPTSLLPTNTALAHHSDANTYMKGRPIQWDGKVTFVSWDGAHVMYQIDVANADGSVESWQVLGGSPQRLARRGIYKGTVNAGDTVTIAGYLNTGSKIVTPVYILPSNREAVQANKLFVGYLANDATFRLPSLN